MKLIGTYGDYKVEAVFEAKTLFPKREVIDDNGEKTVKSCMVRRVKRTLRLTHRSGGIVCFEIYLHAGKTRYRDSREKNGKDNPTEAISELTRMLGVDNDEASKLLALAA